MNSRSNPARYLFVLWLCLSSLSDIRSLQGLVLCFGADGHVAVESSLDGDHCKSPGALPMQGRLGPDADASHCGECRDIRMDGPSMSASPASRSVPVPKLNAPVLDLPYGSGLTVTGSRSARLFPPTAPPKDLALLPIRSTVLRI